MKYLRTSDLAKAVGVHPNTVRRYVDWGLLPPVEHSPSGYRRFTQRHLDCLRLARQVYCNQYPGKAIHQSGIRIIQATVSGDLALVQSERTQADVAASLLERWAFGAPTDATIQPLQIGQVAHLLGVTIDILRNWDRNGLIDVPRDPSNGYRRYGAPEISRVRVIRMLSRAGYSLSAILRMLIQLDRGEKTDLRRALDTPRPDEDVYMASDRWISTLTDQADYRDRLEEFLITQTCPDCAGTRLRPESRVVTVNGQTIIALSRLPLGDLGAWLDGLPAVLSPDEMIIAEPILVELSEGIAWLVEVGAGYLTPERSSPTLSAGETQRLRLASLLGSGLSGVLYGKWARKLLSFIHGMNSLFSPGSCNSPRKSRTT